MPGFSQQGKIIDHTCIDLSKIPLEYINAAKSNLDIYFGHKSHGSQVTSSGMQAIMNFSTENKSIYSYNNDGANGALKIYEYTITRQKMVGKPTLEITWIT
ncbi:MAG: hypothetical protein HC896_16980 [Bacteroidales bacterium]|nr:hypothetical protein [Bacteroidales bacterium]